MYSMRINRHQFKCIRGTMRYLRSGREMLILILILIMFFISSVTVSAGAANQDSGDQRQELVNSYLEEIDEGFVKDTEYLASFVEGSIPGHKKSVDEKLAKHSKILADLRGKSEDEIENYNGGYGRSGRDAYNEDLEEYTKGVTEYLPEVQNFYSKYLNGFNRNNPEHVADFERIDAIGIEAKYNTGTLDALAFDFGYIHTYNTLIKLIPEAKDLLKKSVSEGITAEEYNDFYKRYDYNISHHTQSGSTIGTLSKSGNDVRTYLKSAVSEEKISTGTEEEPSDNGEDSKEEQNTVTELEQVGTVLYSEGLVEITRADTKETIAAQRGMKIYKGDLVASTKSDSYIEFTDVTIKHIQRMKGKGLIKAGGKMVWVQRKSTLRIFGTLLKGTFIGAHVPKTTYIIEDECSITTIKGTDVIVSVDEDGNATYLLYEGAVEIHGKINDVKVDLEAGHKISVSNDGVMSEIEALSETDIAEFLDVPVMAGAFKEGYTIDDVLIEVERIEKSIDANGTDEKPSGMEDESGGGMMGIIIGLSILLAIIIVIIKLFLAIVRSLGRKFRKKDDIGQQPVYHQETLQAVQPTELTIHCGNCGKKVRDGDRFCPDCGTVVKVKSVTRFCTNCGVESKLDSHFCSSCGNPLV